MSTDSVIVEEPSLKFELSGFKRGREVSLDMKSYLVSSSAVTFRN